MNNLFTELNATEQMELNAGQAVAVPIEPKAGGVGGGIIVDFISAVSELGRKWK